MPELKSLPETPESLFKAFLEDKLPVCPIRNVALSFALSSHAASKAELLESLDREIARVYEMLKQVSSQGRREYDALSPGVSPSEAIYHRLHQLRQARDLVDNNL